MNKTFAVICALLIVFASISAGVSVATLSDKESVSLGFSADIPAPDPVVVGDNTTGSVNASTVGVTSVENASRSGTVKATTNGIAESPAPASNESLDSGPPDRNGDGASRNATGNEQVSDLPAPSESTNGTNASGDATSNEPPTDDGQTSPSDQNSTPSGESNDAHSGAEADQPSDSDSPNPPSSDAGDDSEESDTADGEESDTADGEESDTADGEESDADSSSDSGETDIGSDPDDVNESSDGADSTDQ